MGKAGSPGASMKILLDECLPRKLKNDLPGHAVTTVSEMQWKGLKNGELIRLAEQAFDVFVTIDQGVRYQQNLQGAKLAVILLAAPNNRIETLRPLMPRVLTVLQTIRRSEIVRVESSE
jgi:predicted nuclease of predicted toxin-antitoxin system